MQEFSGSAYVGEVEEFAKRKFAYAKHIADLLDEAVQRHMEAALEDILFFAKFLVSAYAILSRSGTGSPETEKLSYEFKENLEKVSSLLKTVMKEAPPEKKTPFVAEFFAPTTQSLERLMTLLRELAWVKNYRIDHDANT